MICTVESTLIFCESWFPFLLIAVFIVGLYYILGIKIFNVNARAQALQNLYQDENTEWLRQNQGIVDRSTLSIYRDYFGVFGRLPILIDLVDWSGGIVTLRVQIHGLWRSYKFNINNIYWKIEDCDQPTMSLNLEASELDEPFEPHFELISDAVTYTNTSEILHRHTITIFLSEKDNRNLPQRKKH